MLAGMFISERLIINQQKHFANVRKISYHDDSCKVSRNLFQRIPEIV